MRLFLRVSLPILVFGVGIASLVGLIMTKPAAKKKPAEDRGILVELAELAPKAERAEVIARGTVVPARQVILSAEVGGRVVWIDDALAPGGRFDARQSVLRVDGRDYRLAVEQQFAAVDRAETELQLEESRKKVAEREWERFGDNKDPGSNRLATREPQMRTAKVAVKSAKSGLRQAKLRVSRTLVRAPFAGIIRERQVEMGQVVAPGAPVATLVGTDAYWVQVSVPVAQLAWFSIPGVNGDQGSVVEVRQTAGDQTMRWEGKVVRLLGEVDPAGRMARVLVEIRDPLGLQTPRETAGIEQRAPVANLLPLLLGSYVEVAIAAREVPDAFVVPRAALHDGDKVHLMTADGTLAIREIEIAWRRAEDVLVTGGLEAGDMLITSPIPAPVAGMKLRTAKSEATASPGERAPDPAKAAQTPAAAKDAKAN